MADNGRIWIRVQVKRPFKMNACELEFTHTCKLVPLSCWIYRVFGLQEVCSTQFNSHLMKGKLLTYEQCHNWALSGFFNKQIDNETCLWLLWDARKKFILCSLTQHQILLTQLIYEKAWLILFNTFLDFTIKHLPKYLSFSVICIGSSMICSDIWRKYHERCFKIVIRNFTSH